MIPLFLGKYHKNRENIGHKIYFSSVDFRCILSKAVLK